MIDLVKGSVTAVGFVTRVLLVFSVGAITACGTLLGIGSDDEPNPAATTTTGDGAIDSASNDGGADADDASVASETSVDADAAIDTFVPPCIGNGCPRWVFVTGAAWSGDQIGGIAGADMKCQIAGDAFKPGRQWRALLSDGTSKVADRFVTSTMADYITGNNLVVAQGWSSFLSNVHMKRIMDDSNQPPPGTDDTWTNTDTSGNPVGDDCFGWTMNVGFGFMGNASALDEKWLNNGALSCTSQAHLYCVEQN